MKKAGAISRRFRARLMVSAMHAFQRTRSDIDDIENIDDVEDVEGETHDTKEEDDDAD